MSEPFIGEIRLLSFSLIPRGWIPCNGQLLPVAQNQALFSILGTSFGGDGIRTFAVPNLQGAAAIHPSVGGPIANGVASRGGEATHMLAANEVPAHTHTLTCSSAAGTEASPNGHVFASSTTPAGATASVDTQYATAAQGGQMLAAGALLSVGGTPHTNLAPSLPLNFCLATMGIYPSRG